MDDRSPNNPKESGVGVKTSSTLAVVPKKPDDLVEEEINSQILSILGLEDVFDLTYEEYASLLKEKAVQGRMTGSKMTTESVELVTNELKRVRGKTGRFKVKQKKININKVFDRKQPVKTGAIVKTGGLTPPVVAQDQGLDGSIVATQSAEITKGLGSILESLVVIKNILADQNKFQKKSAENERKYNESQKKKEKEKKLETKPTDTAKEGNKLKAPVIGFFDAIKRFVKNILLGSVVLGLFKWLKDPSNKQAIDGFTKFLTDNAPLILGGLLAIAALPLAPTLLGLASAITSIAIPALTAAFSFLASPAGLVALAALATTAAVAKGGEVVMQKFQKKVGSTGVTKKGTAFNLGDINALKQEQEKFLTQSSSYSKETRNQVIKPYDDLLEELRKKKRIEDEIETINRNIAAMPQQEWRWKPQLDKKQKELVESSKRSTELFGKLGITDANLKQSQMRRGGRKKDDTYVDPNATRPNAAQNLLANTQRLLGIPSTTKPSITKPQTPMMPGLPASAAQPGAGPAGNKVGSKTRTITPVVTGRYGEKRGSRSHGGTDLAVDEGTPLAAVSDGQIIDSGVDPGGWGNFLVFRDSQGINHLYGHIQDGYKRSGSIKKGEVIAKVGMTGRTSGPHLHWESGTGWTGGLLTGKFDPLKMYSSTAPFTFDPSIETRLTTAQLGPSAPSVPSIPSPTGGNIAMLPLPMGLGQKQQGQSGSAPLQTPVPSFSSEDPNNMTTLVVKAIYNVVG
jgi:murein DD-endopeptidase MepM/ murein hydrolase activator NlpD